MELTTSFKGKTMAIAADSVEKTYEAMKARLSHVVPDFELREKAELAYEINR